MSDFINGFWNAYVIVLVAASLLFCCFIVLANRSEAPKQVELHGHVWDETLAEWNNPLPRWWVGLFWITIVFAVVYLAFYPGLGNLGGNFGWSSKGQYDKEIADANAKYSPIFDKYKGQDLKAVAADRDANAMGERMFLTYCSQCHGSDAKGAKGFPNLTDGDWLYGGEPEQIKTSIMEGRQGAMPPFGQVLDADKVKDVANYVRSLSGLAADSVRVQRGKESFMSTCAACHGPDGKGNQMIGAPNLTDGTWLYGSAEATIMETVTKGRGNRMPAHKDFLGESKVHLLAAYVYSLSAQPAAAK